MDHPLDNVAWTALTGTHARFAEERGRALRYAQDVSPFAALPSDADGSAWADLGALAGAGGRVLFAGPSRTPPPGWVVAMRLPGVQLDGSRMTVEPDAEAEILGPADVPEMLDLTARTRPGPFRDRTHLLGTYLGIRRGGALVAMAGERMRPPGWSEISAVCTDPAHRGHGFGSRLMRAIGAVIRERGDVPFLHAAARNTDAIRLYEHLGFTLRTDTEFAAFEAPAGLTCSAGTARPPRRTRP